MPCLWKDMVLPETGDRVRLCRTFGYPGNVDAWERVWLTFSGVENPAEVILNNQFLGRADQFPFEFDVSSLLGQRNRLEVVFERVSSEGGPWHEVAMEIRATAFLREVRIQETQPGNFRIEGQVVGVSERPLDLYVLANKKTQHYTTIVPTPAGQGFQVDLAQAGKKIRVELVFGSVVWYAVDLVGS